MYRCLSRDNPESVSSLGEKERMEETGEHGKLPHVYFYLKNFQTIQPYYTLCQLVLGTAAVKIVGGRLAFTIPDGL